MHVSVSEYFYVSVNCAARHYERTQSRRVGTVHSGVYDDIGEPIEMDGYDQINENEVDMGSDTMEPPPVYTRPVEDAEYEVPIVGYDRLEIGGAAAAVSDYTESSLDNNGYLVMVDQRDSEVIEPCAGLINENRKKSENKKSNSGHEDLELNSNIRDPPATNSTEDVDNTVAEPENLNSGFNSVTRNPEFECTPSSSRDGRHLVVVDQRCSKIAGPYESLDEKDRKKTEMKDLKNTYLKIPKDVRQGYGETRRNPIGIYYEEESEDESEYAYEERNKQT